MPARSCLRRSRTACRFTGFSPGMPGAASLSFSDESAPRKASTWRLRQQSGRKCRSSLGARSFPMRNISATSPRRLRHGSAPRFITSGHCLYAQEAAPDCCDLRADTVTRGGDKLACGARSRGLWNAGDRIPAWGFARDGRTRTNRVPGRVSRGDGGGDDAHRRDQLGRLPRNRPEAVLGGHHDRPLF